MTKAMGCPADSGRFSHFMLKEIYEQPETMRRILERWFDASGRLAAPAGLPAPQETRRLSKITIAASGSSRHAGLVGKFMLEKLTGVPVEVDFASQYCYRDPIVRPGELTVLISQSGTTVDTMAALQEARRKGSQSLAICNVPDSPLTRKADAYLPTCAGAEVAIAATKSFTSQLTIVLLLSLYLARCRQVSGEQAEALEKELQTLPEIMERVLSVEKDCRELAARLAGATNLLLLGRDIEYPIALEGALKLKETSYIQAEGHPTGEVKHGLAALMTERLPVIFLASRDEKDAESMVRYGRTVANIREFSGRSASIATIITEGDRDAARDAGFAISLPPVSRLLQPILEVIPLQMLAYHAGSQRGYDVDRPRNLSKSVTIE